MEPKKHQWQLKAIEEIAKITSDTGDNLFLVKNTAMLTEKNNRLHAQQLCKIRTKIILKSCSKNLK